MPTCRWVARSRPPFGLCDLSWRQLSKDLRQRLPTLDETRADRGFRARLEALSDVLLASFFATAGFPEHLDRLQDVYRVYHAPAGDDEGLLEPLTQLLARPLLAPAIARRDESPTPPSTGDTPPTISERDGHSPKRSANWPAWIAGNCSSNPMRTDPRRRGTTPFTLTAAGRKLVSAEASAVLKAHGIDLSVTPIDVAVQSLFAAKLALPVKGLNWPRPVVVPLPGVTLPPAPAHDLVRPAGVADLLVVKQQIKRYEGAEIAHVENVLIGEKKSRAHRQLERSEETFLSETESTRTRETELETAERFELNRETSRTLENDQKVGFGLTLSGKYGPTVEFSSTFSAEGSSSQQETAKNSSRYAKDVVNRSLERLTERAREVRTRTVIRETEETNLHELNNQTTKHVSGIYQFLDKVYEAQVFNYGIREMFDFMIPEPASFLWYVEQNPTLDLELPPPPEKLDLLCPDPSYVTEDNAFSLAAEFGAAIDGAAAAVPPAHGDDKARRRQCQRERAPAQFAACRRDCARRLPAASRPDPWSGAHR